MLQHSQWNTWRTGLEAYNFIKKRLQLQHKYFPVNIAKFLRITCFEEDLRRLRDEVLVFQDFVVKSFSENGLISNCTKFKLHKK